MRRPPHVLITTPESLYLLLTSDKGRGVLAGVETVIVDEIHALVGNKRGAHLALSLERLDALVRERRGVPTRIGLVGDGAGRSTRSRAFSTGGEATAARGRVGSSTPAASSRSTSRVEVPKEPLSAVASREAWKDVLRALGALIDEHKTTLIFVPSRGACASASRTISRRCSARASSPRITARWPSGRACRVEQRLQNGQLRAVVATASLELGIDIGDVELVCQLGSPRSIAVLRQRIGRAASRRRWHAQGAHLRA